MKHNDAEHRHFLEIAMRFLHSIRYAIVANDIWFLEKPEVMRAIHKIDISSL